MLTVINAQCYIYVLMLNVIMLNVVMLSVVVPFVLGNYFQRIVQYLRVRLYSLNCEWGVLLGDPFGLALALPAIIKADIEHLAAINTALRHSKQ